MKNQLTRSRDQAHEMCRALSESNSDMEGRHIDYPLRKLMERHKKCVEHKKTGSLSRQTLQKFNIFPLGKSV